jgi:hypothetical protein
MHSLSGAVLTLVLREKEARQQPAAIAALLARCICGALTDMRAGARVANSTGDAYKIIVLLDIDILCALPAALGNPVRLNSLQDAADSESEWESESDVDDTACEVCGRTDDEHNMLLCDGGCNRGYHTACVGLDSVPSGDWECSSCAAANAAAACVAQPQPLPAALHAPRYTAVPPVPLRHDVGRTGAPCASSLLPLLSHGSVRTILSVRDGGTVRLSPVLQVLHITPWCDPEDKKEDAPLMCVYLLDGDDIIRGVLSETLSAIAASGALPRHRIVRLTAYSLKVACGIWCVWRAGAWRVPIRGSERMHTDCCVCGARGRRRVLLVSQLELKETMTHVLGDPHLANTHTHARDWATARTMLREEDVVKPCAVETLKAMLLRAEACDDVTAVANELLQRSTEALQAALCVSSLCFLTQDGDVAKRAARDATVMAALTAILTAATSTIDLGADTLRTLCRTMLQIARTGDAALAVQQRCVTGLVCLMLSCLEDVRTVVLAARAMHGLMLISSTNTGQAAFIGAVVVAVRALRAYPADARVQTAAYACLKLLVEGDADAAVAATKEGMTRLPRTCVVPSVVALRSDVEQALDGAARAAADAAMAALLAEEEAERAAAAAPKSKRKSKPKGGGRKADADAGAGAAGDAVTAAAAAEAGGSSQEAAGSHNNAADAAAAAVAEEAGGAEISASAERRRRRAAAKASRRAASGEWTAGRRSAQQAARARLLLRTQSRPRTCRRRLRCRRRHRRRRCHLHPCHLHLHLRRRLHRHHRLYRPRCRRRHPSLLLSSPPHPMQTLTPLRRMTKRCSRLCTRGWLRKHWTTRGTHLPRRRSSSSSARHCRLRRRQRRHPWLPGPRRRRRVHCRHRRRRSSSSGSSGSSSSRLRMSWPPRWLRWRSWRRRRRAWCAWTRRAPRCCGPAATCCCAATPPAQPCWARPRACAPCAASRWRSCCPCLCDDNDVRPCTHARDGAMAS